MEEKPYLIAEVTTEVQLYNPNYGDHRICKCTHQYHRHFDSYDDMDPCGCRYCPCDIFVEDPDSNGCIKKKTVEPTILEETDYDPGYLNDYGGGDAEWWRNYIRSLINDCNAYWRSIIESYLED